jgi:hypothetical protein
MPAEDVEMMHLEKIYSLGHTTTILKKSVLWVIQSPYSVTSIKAFLPQQYTDFLLTISDLIKSNFLCPKLKRPPPPQRKFPGCTKILQRSRNHKLKKTAWGANSLSTTRARLSRDWIQGTVYDFTAASKISVRQLPDQSLH